MMRQWRSLMALGVCLGVIGCVRMHTRIVEMPRVDQEVEGNRGYMRGPGSGRSAQAPRKTTRQVIMTDVELPTLRELKPVEARVLKPVKGDVGPGNRGYVIPEEQPVPEAPMATSRAPFSSGRVVIPKPAPSFPEAFEELPPVEPLTPRVVAPEVPTAPVAPSVYTVQKGDTLEKIAKKVYGNATRWPKIYRANRHVLTNANRVYPGQVLTIPDLSAEPSSRQSRGSEEESLK